MSSRDSKRFAVLINPNETPLQPVPESPTVSSYPSPEPSPTSKSSSKLSPDSKSASKSPKSSSKTSHLIDITITDDDNDKHKHKHKQLMGSSESKPSSSHSNQPLRQPSTASSLSNAPPLPTTAPMTTRAIPANTTATSSSSPSAPPPSFRNRSQSASAARPRNKSAMRRAPPVGLSIESSKLNVSRRSGASDFPSPGRAPQGQRIFDASAFAEKREGVEVAQPGWAVDSRTQNKLETDHYKEEHPDEQENMGQRIHRSLSTVKRSASLSVQRAKSLRRPRGNSNAVQRLDSMDEMSQHAPFEDEDAKMVRMSVVKPNYED